MQTAVVDDAIPPKTGENVVLLPPPDVPDGVKPPNPNQAPIDPATLTGIGEDGDVIGPPMGEDVVVTGNNNPQPAALPVDMVMTPDLVEEQPSLDRGGLSRLLERNYPQRMRDAGMTGRVLLEVIVDEDGRVRPNSARVVETSHPQFGEAAVRASERFRFRPARIGGVAVPVRVTIPILWSVAD
ncbi:energy transducer TonB [Longimicrobium terrae]|nr:energy transducer TonB [Longimicrobium terrae]NNC29149.1 TonB family protein [Longimicrobium terrae]